MQNVKVFISPDYGGGGSGSFQTLFFIRFSLGRGPRHGHILMRLLAAYSVGDRFGGKIILKRGGVLLGQFKGPSALLSRRRRFIRWPPKRLRAH